MSHIEEEIKSLKEEDQQAWEEQERIVTSDSGEPTPPNPGRPRRRRSRRHGDHSITGPIILIGIGAYFLLRNLGYITGDLNWALLFSLWPLFLIVAGLSIITSRISERLGQLFSFLTFLLVAGILFFGNSLPFIGGLLPSEETLEENFSYTLEGADQITYEISTSSQSVNITTSGDADLAIDGSVSYNGRLEHSYTLEDNGEAVFRLQNDSGFGFASGDWDLVLNESIPTDLDLNLASGSSQMNLSAMQLNSLVLDSGSGSWRVQLPDGSFESDIDSGSGSGSITFPNQGQIDMAIDSGSGSIRLIIPNGIQAEIQVDQGSGGFIIDDRFELVEGERGDNSIWQTPDYNDGLSNRISIDLDSGSGSITVTND